MAGDPLDIVIGADEAKRDAEQAQQHATAAIQAETDGDREAAIGELRKAVAAHPGNNDLAFRLAYQLDLVGEEDEAIQLYERIVEEQPAPVNALLNLAVLYEDRADYSRAERCLRQVLDTQPNHPRARLFMKDVQASRLVLLVILLSILLLLVVVEEEDMMMELTTVAAVVVALVVIDPLLVEKVQVVVDL